MKIPRKQLAILISIVIISSGLIIYFTIFHNKNSNDYEPPLHPDEVPTQAWSRVMGEAYSIAREPKVDYQGMINDGTWNGLPIGGLGAGAIGRSHRGDFNRWHVDPKRHVS